MKFDTVFVNFNLHFCLIYHYSNIDYAEFSHCPEKKFTDFSHVKQEIEENTNYISERKDDISSTPIILRIYSSKGTIFFYFINYNKNNI